MDVGDKICWWQLWDVGDGFGRFCHQHPLSFKIVTKIKPPTSTCHQHLCSPFGPKWNKLKPYVWYQRKVLLVFYSLFLMYGYCENASLMEWYLFAWVLAMFVDELRIAYLEFFFYHCWNFMKMLRKIGKFWKTNCDGTNTKRNKITDQKNWP